MTSLHAKKTRSAQQAQDPIHTTLKPPACFHASLP